MRPNKSKWYDEDGCKLVDSCGPRYTNLWKAVIIVAAAICMAST